MKKILATTLVTVITATMLVGCSKEPEKTYKNEVTGAMIDENLKDQRPVAIMLSADSKSPDSNIIYEYKVNNDVKRLALVKDWAKIKEIKSIAESDQTAKQIAPGWNAIIIANTDPSEGLPYLNELKAESIKGKDIGKLLKEKEISEKYNEFHSGGDNLRFEENSDMSALSGAVACNTINTDSGSYAYDEQTKKYRNEAGEEYKNIILQNAIYLGLNGDDYYNLSDSDRDGWFIREGYAAPVTWAKLIDLEPTKFYDTDGKEIQLSEGNTLINIISQDEWDSVKIE